jgi:hypothetical protein
VAFAVGAVAIGTLGRSAAFAPRALAASA